MEQRVFRANEQVRRVAGDDGSAELLNESNGRAVRLNQAGCIIWAQLSRPSTLIDIATVLAAAYPTVPYEQVKRDTEQFLGELEPDFITSGFAEQDLLPSAYAGERMAPSRPDQAAAPLPAETQQAAGQVPR